MENRQRTLLEIARELNLSRTTVSVCLSGNAEKYRVKPETVALVKTHAEKMNYIPNRIARSLKSPGVSPVGLIMSEDSSAEKSLYAMRRAMKMLDKGGREFIVQNFLENHISDAVASLKGMNVTTIVMFGSFSERLNAGREPEDQLVKFRADQSRLASLLRNVQFYSVDYKFPVLENSSLQICRLGINRNKVYTKLFNTLFKAGQTPIVCDENCISDEVRRNLADSGFDIPPEHIIIMPDNTLDDNLFKIGHKLTRKIVDLINADRIRTVVLHNDKVAAGLIDGLLANGYSVPKDISVIGFDNIDAAAYFKVPLTTIELPVMKNTIMVIESILSNIDIPMVVESEAKIVWRDSAKIT